jgi:phosphoribosylanthranilate isomerase
MGRNDGELTVMWTKICGITRVVDAQATADAGADAVGLNFYSASKRFIEPDKARAIADVVRPKLDVVGVFVNSPAQDVIDVVNRVHLTAVQFHGDETVECIVDVAEACPDVAIVRAFRLRKNGMEDVIQSIRELQHNDVSLAAVLVDAFVADEYGGTGHMIAADLFGEFRQRLISLEKMPDDSGALQSPSRSLRVILAGGLTPETVASATAAVQPWGVDTASGVESAPGIKSSDMIRRFVKAVRTTEPVESSDRL